MPRLFFEVQYKGTHYAGFQVQQNARTIQGELEAALETYCKEKVELTGSSRTDAGVHAKQNFFHADVSDSIAVQICDQFSKAGYNLNAILSRDINLVNIFRVPIQAHARFDALSREYCYTIAMQKDPFTQEYAYFYPFVLNTELLEEAAAIIKLQTHFQAFSKKHTQVNNFTCIIQNSEWDFSQKNQYTYHVKGSRFLRGMVKALVGTMLLVGREKMSLHSFEELFQSETPALADFTPPSHGLCLVKVDYN